WPTTGAGGDASMIDPVGEVLGAVRRAKTEAKASQKAAVERVVVGGPAGVIALVRAAEGDLRDAGSVAVFEWTDAAELTCTVTLAPRDTETEADTEADTEGA
ncbi:MAG: valine--tRNA ligase, partial [Acidobacteria bacterium]|nr:valine--tRNA ligase [Acidobacteriota bacterium]